MLAQAHDLVTVPHEDSPRSELRGSDARLGEGDVTVPHEDSPRSERDATRYASQLAEKPRARISSATSTSTSSSREIDDEYLLEQASHTAVQILAVDTFC